MPDHKAQEITRHIKPRPVGRVYISTAAVAELRMALAEQSVSQEQYPDESLFECVGASFLNFAKSDYAQQSLWFKSQPEHTFVGMSFLDPETKNPRSYVRLVARHLKSSRDVVIIAPGEAELPEDYYEQRVIEEARIHYDRLINQ